MREIKFRAWRDNKMEYELEEATALECGLNYLIQYMQGSQGFTLMQYTGLHDKNGRECYWDDWVSDGINPRFLVTPDYHLLARLSEIEFEILGNKYEMGYENPELC